MTERSTTTSWINVGGIVVRGHRVASGTAANGPYPHSSIAMQKPFFRRLGLDLAACYDGTLNISIHPRTFVLQQPRFTFRQVHWTTLHPPEDFSFSACQLVVHSQTYAGWVYYPHPQTKRAHQQSPSLVEVLAPLIADVAYGDQVEVRLDPHEIIVL